MGVASSPVVVVVAMIWFPGVPAIPNLTAFSLRKYVLPALSPQTIPVVLLPGNVIFCGGREGGREGGKGGRGGREGREGGRGEMGET